MAETRSLPLRDVAKLGRFGAAAVNPGVVLSVVHPVTLAAVVARKGKSKAVANALKLMRSASIRAAGPDQYFVEGVATSDLKYKLGVNASVIDQSHGRVAMCVSGPRCRDVLARGTPVDLHHEHFLVGQSAMTQIAHIGVQLTRTGEDEFMISVFRSFSESLWEWLAHSAAQFGYEVR